MRTMKKGLCWLLMLSMILSLFAGMAMAAGSPATATPTPTAESDFTFESGKITGYAGSDEDVVIPAKLGGTTVTSIDDGAFICDTSISTIVIPSTVTYIGSYAFDYQYMLTDIYFYGKPVFADDMLDVTATSITFHCRPEYESDFADASRRSSPPSRYTPSPLSCATARHGSRATPAAAAR